MQGLKFICKDVHLSVERHDTLYTTNYKDNKIIKVPVAHHDGNYFADDDIIAQLEDQGRVAFRYCDEQGAMLHRAPILMVRAIISPASMTKNRAFLA